VVAARQALLLVTGMRRLEDHGSSSAEAMLQAASERLEPTVVSGLAIAAAVLPFVVLGDVAGNEILHPMAAVILSGMSTVAIVVLVITPLVCLRLGAHRASQLVVVPGETPPPEIHPQEV
jgi:multidrug efflux pump